MNKKIVLVLAILGVLVITGCTSAISKGADAKVSLTGETKEFTIEAFQFGYEPNVIEVNLGDKVKITGISRDVPHGIVIAEFGVNMYLDGINADTVEFIADKRGEYRWYCNVPCGRGHGTMQGTLIVK